MPGTVGLQLSSTPNPALSSPPTLRVSYSARRDVAVRDAQLERAREAEAGGARSRDRRRRPWPRALGRKRRLRSRDRYVWRWSLARTRRSSAEKTRRAPAAREIVERISKGEWTASDVLEAYIARATLAHQRVNCLTEGLSVCRSPMRRRAWRLRLASRFIVMFADARAEARALDKEFVATGSVRGPLHGVPVSFKDPCTSRAVLCPRWS